MLELERPICLYTIEELENLVVRAVKLEDVWTSANPTPVRRTQLRRPDASSIQQLLPGGRWLLLGTSDAADGIDYFDLDEKEPKPRPLILPEDIVGKGDIAELAIDIQENVSLLTFELALLSTHLLGGY